MKLQYSLLASLVAMSSVASAASIAINFAENTNQQFAGGAAIGPTGIDSSNWNSTIDRDSGTLATGTMGSLIDDTGATTTSSVTWSSNNVFYNADGTGTDEARLAVGYLDDSTGVTVTVSNITYSTYTAYVLFTSDQNGDYQHGEITVEGTALFGGGDFNAHGRVTDGTGWVEADGTVFGNYATITGLTDSTLDITSIRNGAARGPITGVIIVDTTAVPEPTSTALLGLGGLALIMRRRK
ncbi:PEP-CTERM protein-sorting domain-containing protein [Rubritalea squalenifaciens DSM 18772]|uniref:PEP-CTERM protein-sorting domain-containing protein n=1 Tax=Rubritalea squalenifaciens DSM 18772 TaxID=1123071 RepID=A0A1M6B4A2_9BACT|nr:PEP-CTERM sorting domain-containing protein [Rubritalea squalenifaciens]SHI43569.1 PEP-CTERM protein-sorting domain-containing protein [Rubritalea squalenifaciens DSM 18772]